MDKLQLRKVRIGRYDITSTYLMTNSGSNASGIGGNQAFGLALKIAILLLLELVTMEVLWLKMQLFMEI
ncbi:MAG: hypothetical protein ACLUP6_06395 [Anaerostipes hadrus]